MEVAGCGAADTSVSARTLAERQPDGKRGAVPEPFALDGDAAAVHFGQLSGQGETDAEPAFGAIERAVGLGEQVEHAAAHFGRQADAVVGDADHGLAVFGESADLDAPAFGRVLGGVGEQVGDDLLGARGIGEERHRLVGHVDRQLVLLLVHDRPHSVGGAADDRQDIDVFLLEGDLIAVDARNIEQIVDEPREVLRLAVDDVEQFLAGSIWRNAAEVDGVADGGERVAQLVGEHGQELVLLPDGVLDGVIQPRVVDGRGDALGEALRQADLARRVAAARDR